VPLVAVTTREPDVSAPPISLWRTPRARSLLLLGMLAALAGGVSLVAHQYTDLLWFRELGQEDVFWTTLKWRIIGHGVPFFGTAGLLIVNFAAVERVMAAHSPLRPHRRLVYPLAAVGAGLISSEWRADGAWRLLAMWAGRSDFGVADPLFHRDVEYFVFSLPLYEQAARWLLDTIAMAGVATVAAYLAAGGLRMARPYVIVRAARAHLLVLGALALVVVAWRYRLDQFALTLPHGGSELPGAGYTEVHVRLPALRIMVWLSLAGAVLLLYAAARRVPRAPLAALAVLAVLALVGPGVVSGVVQRFEVDPQVLTRERPYLSYAIAATRRAFDLDRVRVRTVSGHPRLSARDIARSRHALANVPLWDSKVLRPAMDDQQSIGRYYRFPSTTVDRYEIDGKPRILTIGARQLDLRGLGRDVRGWTNDRFAYTHGYGVVAVRPTPTGAGGQPRFVQGEFRAGRNPLGVSEPRIYFSEQRGSNPPYLVVRSLRGEVDQPIPGSRHSDYRYEGPGGIPLSSPGRLVAFAARFGDLNLLLSESVTSRSRIVLHRNVLDRLRTLAPFLRWDSRPQKAVIDGRVTFLVHGYTTSDHYPYADSVRVGRSRVNYLRAAADAAVDAFSGRVRIYANDSGDPIVRAWQATYPGLLIPADRMPPQIRAHLRYPRELFAAQIAAYAGYHADDATGFWNGADAWQVPAQLAGPVEAAGEIHFPERPKRVRAELPDYLFGRLPGDARERLLLATGFTARGRENLVAYLAGSIDDRGRPRLTLLSLPRDRLTAGPTQATRRVLASARVNRRLEILNRESRDLGKAALNRTVIGAPRLLPVGDALVHVQPIYLIAGGSGVPRLQLVTAYANGRVGYGRDLETALRRTVGGRAR
jgi:uncharacterized protein